MVQVDPTKPTKKNLELYQLLCQLLKDEETCINKVRESESEVRSILKERLEEETRSELEISVYDTTRNERAKKHRKELVSYIRVTQTLASFSFQDERTQDERTQSFSRFHEQVSVFFHHS